MTMIDRRHFVEGAYDEWAWDVYDEWYDFLWTKDRGPMGPIERIMLGVDDLRGKPKRDVRILDAACGTGNLYAALSTAGFDAWGTDGSAKMLERALANCRGRKISTEQLIPTPVAWTDAEAYQRHFLQRGLSFDLIVVATNSFCHLPSTPTDTATGQPSQRHMQDALTNFYDLLKPNGRLLIDTKRYKAEPDATFEDEVNNQKLSVRMFSEINYDSKKTKTWLPRLERTNTPVIKGKNTVCHTHLHSDVDPCFKLCRALVVATIFDRDDPRAATPRIAVLPYYPLPAEVLEREMRVARFEPEILRARDDTSPVGDWSYDFVVGYKG
jgi:SAM-dependent methyltransferase